MKKKHTQAGFTIIELSIATLVFSVLLAIIMAAFLNIGRLYVKGANLSLTQQNSRTIMDSISSDIRFSQGTPSAITVKGSESYFCVGQHRYKFMLYHQVQSNSEVPQPGTLGYPNYGLVRENVTGCPTLSSTKGVTQPVEMLSSGMLLNDLHFGPTAANTCDNTINLCTITINLLFYGADNSVFTSSEHSQDTPSDHLAAIKDPDVHCAGSDLGTQFCASTSYTTTVLQSSQ